MGYSVFIKTTKHYDEDLDADAIVDEAIKQNKLEADEADYCDYVSEISEQEYKDAAPRTEVESKQIKMESTNKEYIATYKMPNGTFFELYKDNEGNMFDQNGNEIGEKELSQYEKVSKNTKNELVNVGDKFINQNGAMITILEPTKNNEVQFKVTNTKTGEEGTDVYITSSIDKILKDNGYIKVEENKLQENNTDLEYKYMLLDRLKQDCEYFLGNGNGNAEHSLWAKDIDEQIEKMKEIYNSFSEEEKPDWITLEDINNYEKRMKEYNKDIKTEAVSQLDDTTMYVYENELTDKNIIAKLYRNKIYELIYKNNKKDLVKISNIALGQAECKSILSGHKFKIDIVDMVKDGRVIETDYTSNNEDIKTESVVSDYTLSEIKKVIDSVGDDFNLKISNADIDVETKTLSIDREDLISIYNTLGGNKDFITESRPDKDRARAAAFAGSRRRLQLPTNGLNEEAEIIEYLEKCKNQIDIMNVNEAIKNTELRNKLLTTGFDFAKSVNIVDDHIDEFKNVMIKATQDYFQNIKTESKKDSDLKSQYYDFLKQEIKKYCKNGTCKIKADKANTGYPEDNLYISIKEDVEKIADEKLKQYILSEIEENDFWGDMYVCGYKDTKTESKEGYQDKCCMCGTSNLNGCYSVLDEEGNVGSVCVDCGKKYSLPEIEKKINSDMKSESKVNLKEDQYEYNRRKGRPNIKKIAETEYYDNQEWYDKNINKYEDMQDFIYEEVAGIAREYNLKEKAATEVCELVYLMAMKRI